MNTIKELALDCIVYAETFLSISTRWGTYENGRPKWEDEYIKNVLDLTKSWVLSHTKLKYLNKNSEYKKELSDNIPFSVLYYFNEPSKSFDEYTPKLKQYIQQLEKFL